MIVFLRHGKRRTFGRWSFAQKLTPDRVCAPILSGTYRIMLLAACLNVPACSWLPRPVTFHDPLTAHEHVVLGETYLKQGALEPATHEFEAAVKREPHHVPALLLLGNLAFQRQSWDQAESFYRRALQHDPDHAAAANNLAMVYLTRGERFDEVERLARHALQQGTNLTPYIYETIATLYVKQGRFAEAQAAAEEAEASMDPSNKPLQDRLAELRHEIASHSSSMPAQH
jgi:Tfp pilus assembly protein PilF